MTSLGLREVALDDVYAHYARTAHALGEPLPAEALPTTEYSERPHVRLTIDPSTGVVETVNGQLLPDAPRRLIRDAGGRLFTWEAAAGPVAWDGDGVVFEYHAERGDGGTGRYVVLGPVPEEIAAFELPTRYWRIEVFDYGAGYLLARGGSELAVVDLARGTTTVLDRSADPAHTFPPWIGHYDAWRGGDRWEVLRVDGGFAVIAPSPGGDRGARVLRYRWPDEFLSDVVFEYLIGPEHGSEGNLSETGYRLSPDGRHVAITSRIWGEYRGGTKPALTVVSVLDAGTGEERMRIGGATFPVRYMSYLPVHHPGVWLADGSGLVVRTVSGHRIATLDGQWLPIPERLASGRLLPSPDDPALFLHDMATVVDIGGATRISLVVDRSESPHAGWWTQWGDSSRELRLDAVPSGRGREPVYPVMHAAIQIPPFMEAAAGQFVVDGCLHSEPHAESSVRVCLPGGSPVEIVRDAFRRHLVWTRPETCLNEVRYECIWVHVLAEDGSRGWVQARLLRWGGTPVPAGAPPPDPSCPRGHGDRGVAVPKQQESLRPPLAGSRGGRRIVVDRARQPERRMRRSPRTPTPRRRPGSVSTSSVRSASSSSPMLVT